MHPYTVTETKNVLNTCAAYADAWKLKFSADKCKIVVFNVPNPLTTWKLGSITIKTQTWDKYLTNTFSSTRGDGPHLSNRLQAAVRMFHTLKERGILGPNRPLDWATEVVQSKIWSLLDVGINITNIYGPEHEKFRRDRDTLQKQVGPAC